MPFSTNKKQGTRRDFVPGRPHRDLLGSNPPFSFAPQSSGKQKQDKKGNTVLDKEVNHKLGKGLGFKGAQLQCHSEFLNGKRNCVNSLWLEKSPRSGEAAEGKGPGWWGMRPEGGEGLLGGGRHGGL